MVELLAPVRNEVSFSAACDAGADAVYFGLGQLNMRINSRGIEVGELGRIVARGHERGVKVYVVVNAIVFDQEMGELSDLLGQVKACGVDAVICWDFAVVQRCKALGIPIHISTQASIANTEAAMFYKNIGAERIVPARELSLDQIKQIKRDTGLEIEAFVHGAMCVSVSGRCFMSQYLYGRSANRGDCLQPCRYDYHITDKDTGKALDIGNGYVLSPKDLCTLPVVDKLMESGIDSFKIEGRSRPPEYVRAVVGAYRRAIDAVLEGRFTPALVETLTADVEKVYNRGFSTGFLFGRPMGEDWSDTYGGQATKRKLFVGKVLNYYKGPKAVYVRVSNPLAVGDVIQAHGATTGVVEMVVKELRDDEKGSVSSVNKGNVTFISETLLRRNDDIYKIVDAEIGG